MKNKQQALEKVLSECFWGDYQIELSRALSLLKSKNQDFIQFLILRIISESSFPSARLWALFSLPELEKYLPRSLPHPLLAQKLRLVRSVLFREIPGGVRPWKVYS